MAILNKKSMLFLLATTLLICSSYADDDLSSAGMEERGLAINFAQELKFSTLISTRAAQKLYKYNVAYKRIKKIAKSQEDFKDLFGRLCTIQYCNHNGYKCDGLLCVQKRARNQTIDCEKDCGGK